MIRLLFHILSVVLSTIYLGGVGFILSAVLLSAYLADLTIQANDPTERVNE